MKRVKALERFTLSSGVTLERGEQATVSDGEASKLLLDKKVCLPHVPENRTYK